MMCVCVYRFFFQETTKIRILYFKKVKGKMDESEESTRWYIWYSMFNFECTHSRKNIIICKFWRKPIFSFIHTWVQLTLLSTFFFSRLGKYGRWIRLKTHINIQQAKWYTRSIFHARIFKGNLKDEIMLNIFAFAHTPTRTHASKYKIYDDENCRQWWSWDETLTLQICDTLDRYKCFKTRSKGRYEDDWVNEIYT